MPNPFLKGAAADDADEELEEEEEEELEDDPDADEDPNGEELEDADAAAAGDEGKDDKAAEDPAAELFGEEEDEDAELAKPVGKGTPLHLHPRFVQVTKRVRTAEARAGELEGRVKELEPFERTAQAVTELYGARGADPVAAMRWDANFLDAWQKLAATDAAVNAVAVKVRQFMESGTVERGPAKNQGTTEARPAADPRIDELVREGARGKVDAVLQSLGVSDTFRKILGDVVLTAGTDGLDRGKIVARAQAYIAEKGITKAQLTGKAAPARKRVVTVRGSSGAAGAEDAEGEEPEPKRGARSAARKPAKDVGAWRRNHQKLLNTVARGLGRSS